MTPSRFLVPHEITGLSPAVARSRSAEGRRTPPRKRSAKGSSPNAPRAPVRCAAFATLADLESGIAGGLGLIELAACALDLEIAVRFRDPIDRGERLSFAFGIGALRTAALARRFNVLLLSSPCSFGHELNAALATFEHMRTCNVAVFAGSCGWLRPGDFERYCVPEFF